MAGFVVSPETIRVLIHWKLHTRPQLNVIHARFSTVGPMNPASPQTVFAALAAAMTSTGYADTLATTTELSAVGMVDLRNASVPEVLSTGAPVLGVTPGNPLPDQVSFVLTLRTAKTGRSHRGRIFTLGWSAATLTLTGEAAAANATTAVNFYTALRTALAGEGMQMAIRSPALPERPSKPGGMLPAKPFELTDVTAIEARDHLFDTNRRRTDLLRR